MIPATYYCAIRRNTFEVQVFDVKPHWACAPFARFRCLIGVWNFECTSFITIAQGNGMTEQEAFETAVRNALMH